MTESADARGLAADRRAGAMAIVRRYVLLSAGAGLITIPIVDVSALAAVHIALIKEITEYYGAEFSEHTAGSILIAIGASLIPGSIGSSVGRRVLRALPFVTHGIGLAGMSAFSALVSYGLGTIVVRHFEASGTLLDFDIDHLHRAFRRT